MVVPDDLLLTFFRETTSRLREMDPEKVLVTETKNNDSHLDLPDCRRCVLSVQLAGLKDVTEKFQKEQQANKKITPVQVQERLGQLQQEPGLSSELKTAMEAMNDAARIGVCKLILYTEEVLAKSTSRDLQDSGRLERTKLMEYLGLCQAAHKLPCVVKFLNKTGAVSIFEKEEPGVDNDNDNKTTMKFPNTRLEYVQQLLAKGMGWAPAFVTAQCKKIFVEKSGDVDYNYYDSSVIAMFRQLVQEMTIVLQLAAVQIKSKQNAEQLNDLAKGGNTRVVSVQYSEFEVDQNGNKIESKNNAPESGIDERQKQLTEEEKKRQLRLASEANVLQQTILGELLAMDESERAHTLNKAAKASQKFMEDAMALPMGQERINFLRSVDPTTSRQLAMHKIWNGMLQANGGKPPKMASQK